MAKKRLKKIKKTHKKTESKARRPVLTTADMLKFQENSQIQGRILNVMLHKPEFLSRVACYTVRKLG